MATLEKAGYERLVRSTVEHGAYTLRGYMRSALDELPVIDEHIDAWDIQPLLAKAPHLGTLALGLGSVLCDAEITGKSHDIDGTSPGKEAWLHTDSITSPYGLTALVPLEGPPADFWSADKQLLYPAEADQARHSWYGVGDVMLLRQRLLVVEGDVATQYEQEYHAGFAAEDRRLAVIDLRAVRAVLG